MTKTIIVSLVCFLAGYVCAFITVLFCCIVPKIECDQYYCPNHPNQIQIDHMSNKGGKKK